MRVQCHYSSLIAGYDCSEHPGKELTLYCETCGVLICMKCAIKNGRHRSHAYKELDEAFEKYKGEVVSLLWRNI